LRNGHVPCIANLPGAGMTVAAMAYNEATSNSSMAGLFGVYLTIFLNEPPVRFPHFSRYPF